MTSADTPSVPRHQHCGCQSVIFSYFPVAACKIFSYIVIWDRVDSSIMMVSGVWQAPSLPPTQPSIVTRHWEHITSHRDRFFLSFGIYHLSATLTECLYTSCTLYWSGWTSLLLFSSWEMFIIEKRKRKRPKKHSQNKQMWSRFVTLSSSVTKCDM